MQLTIENSYHDNPSDKPLSAACRLNVSFREEVKYVRAHVKDASLAYVFYQLPWTRYSCLTVVSPTRAEGTGGIPLHQTSHTHTHKSLPNLCFQGDTGPARRRDAVVNSGDRVL